jgi:uncharacterized repeat protein (TIGR01451 family)
VRQTRSQKIITNLKMFIAKLRAQPLAIISLSTRAIALLLLLSLANSVDAQELLTNRSFESPVGVNGNNIGVVIPGWTCSAVTNIVRPFVGYGPAGPEATPTGGGSQYFDIASSGGTMRQSFVISQAGMIDFSVWYSVREYKQALASTLVIRNSGGTIIATATVNFVVTDPLGTWKQAKGTAIPVAAGTYTFEAQMDDYHNIDLASVVYSPPLSVTKSSAAYSDPVNNLVNPKRIPGGFVDYTLTVANTGSYTVSANTVLVSDPTPTGLELFVGDINGVGSGPAKFTDGSPSSALTYSFASLGSTTDDIEFSNNAGVSWTYVPVANANGVDPNITQVRVRPKGSMAASSSFAFKLRYRIK